MNRTLAALKWTAIAVGAVLLLVVLALTIFIEPIVEFGLSRIWEREVEIGTVDFDLDLTPSVHAENVSVANAKWSDQTNLLNAGVLEISLDLPALFDGQVVLPELKLINAELLLQKSPMGEANWKIGAQQPDDVAPRQRLLVIQHLVVEESDIRYLHPSRDVSAHIETLEGTSGSGKDVIMNGTGTLDGRQLDVSFTGDPLNALQGSDLPYLFEFDLKSEDMKARVAGTAIHLLTRAALNVDVLLEGPHTARLFELFDVAVADFGAYHIEGKVSHLGAVWQVSELSARVGMSELSGEIAVDLSGEKPFVKADLISNQLDFGAVVKLANKPTENKADGQSDKRFNLEVLSALDAEVSLKVNEIVASQGPVNSAQLDLVLKDSRLRIDRFKLDMAQGGFSGEILADASNADVQGNVEMQFDDVPLAPLLDPFYPRYAIDGIVEGRFAVAFSGDDIGIAEGRVGYRLPKQNTHLVFTLNRERIEQDWLLEIHGDGKFRGAPAKLDFSGQPFVLLSEPEAQIPVEIEIALAQSQAKIAGTIASLGKEFDFNASVSGPDTAKLSELIDVTLPELPRYSATGRIVRRDDVIEVENLKAKIGVSDLSGSALLNTEGKRPFLKANLKASTLAYADFDQLQQKSDEPFDWEKLRKLDADLEIAAGKVLFPEQLSLVDFRLDATLKKGLLKLRPLRFNVGGGEVALNLTLDADRKKLLRGTINADVAGVDLGHALKPFGLAERFPGLLDANVDLALNAERITQSAPSSFRYRETQAGNDVTVSLSQTPAETVVKGTGEFHNEPFRLTGTLGRFNTILSPRPYPIDLHILMLETEARIHGEINEPLQMKGFDLALEVSGPNPQRLDPIVGFNLPDLPPYRLRGDLSRRGTLWKFANFKGTVGDSDLAGQLAVDTSAGKPFVSADLDSKLLDFDDLAGLIGAPPNTDSGETASAEQRERAVRRAASARTLPDERLKLTRLANFNADVSYHAERVQSDTLPIDAMTIDFKLQDGHLTFAPLQFGGAGGNVTLRIALDGASDPAAGKIEAEFSQIKLAPILKNIEVARNSLGVIGGRASLWVTGNSIAEMLASADGGAFLLSSGGQLNALLVELAGLDGSESLIRWLGETRTVDMRCALLDLQARDGKVDIARGVIDSTDTRFNVDGAINLNNERLNIVIRPSPKDVSLFVARAPLIIEGSFKDPEFHVSRGSLIARGVAALGLGAIFPPAALLALVEPGLGEDAPCEIFEDTFKELR